MRSGSLVMRVIRFKFLLIKIAKQAHEDVFNIF